MKIESQGEPPAPHSPLQIWWKKNAVFLLILVGIFSLSLLWIFSMEEEEGEIATISQRGEVLQEIDLSKVTEPYEISLTDGDRYNTIAVTLGEIAVIQANCPDKVCINQGFRNSGTIICLPHQLVISFSGGDYDIISG
ncbi:MAG: NusG domain II-containing protein [Eubacteriales bacterium]